MRYDNIRGRTFDSTTYAELKYLDRFHGHHSITLARNLHSKVYHEDVDVIHLVDSHEYATTNCFQHQLMKKVNELGVPTLSLADIRAKRPECARVVCCLKARTLHANVQELKVLLGRALVVIYDQDPWESFVDDGKWRGTYELAMRYLNIETIAVTTPGWVPFLRRRSIPATLVRMWMLPEYCNSAPSWNERAVNVGFIGSAHPHRKAAFRELAYMGCDVTVLPGGRPYVQYLEALSGIKFFIDHSSSVLRCDGEDMDLKDALWVKEVEVASRGCFVLRNRGSGSKEYLLNDVSSVVLYDDLKEVPDIIRTIENTYPEERQQDLNCSVACIRSADAWTETARMLVRGA